MLLVCHDSPWTEPRPRDTRNALMSEGVIQVKWKKWAVTGEWWAVSSQQWVVSNEQWALTSDQWTVNCEYWVVIRKHCKCGSEQWLVRNEHCVVGNEQWAVNNEQMIVHTAVFSEQGGRSCCVMTCDLWGSSPGAVTSLRHRTVWLSECLTDWLFDYMSVLRSYYLTPYFFRTLCLSKGG